jgi:arylsulfatase A-like enzyme
MVSVDTLRLDHAREMESLAKLSRRGAFLEGQAPSPWTLPSMATLMTGVEPARHGALRLQSGFSPIDARVATLAERLSAAGYDTAASVENPFLGSSFGFHRGFARYRHHQLASWSLPRAPYARRARPLAASLLGWAGILPPPLQGVHQQLADASEFLEDRRDRPLFLWIHVLDPHLPYGHAFELKGVPLPDRVALFTAKRRSSAPPPADTLALYRAAYRHEVEVVDRALAGWLDSLPPAPAGRIVVLVADHGEAFGEHGGFEHGHSMYQELLSVPLVIAGIPGVETAGAVGLVDVVPTLLGALGLEAEELDGQDLRFRRPAPIRSLNTLYGSLDLRAVRMGSEKLIAEGSRREAYRLDADPRELERLDASPLESLLPGDPPPRPSLELAPRLIEQLRELGYGEVASP